MERTAKEITSSEGDYSLTITDFQQMWEQAAAKLGEWKKRGIDTISISVNVSTKDFYYADLYQVFTGLVEKYDINPGLLNIEITETVFMSDMQLHMEVINKLRAYGFHIEIDDFGSGYTTFGDLQHLDISIVKIDRSITHNSVTDTGFIILKNIIQTAHDIGFKTLCEGVETKEQLDFLQSVDCDMIQGYYFAKPMPIEEFEEKYKE